MIVAASVRQRQTSNSHPATMNNLFLIGYRGTGKSTVARLLAERLGWGYVDADALLEEKHGRTIRQIFADEGETGFREKEQTILAEICKGGRQVVATGGGVILRKENRDQLRAAGKAVWLRADPETIWQRLQACRTTAERRPPLTVGGLEEIRELLEHRQPLYEQCADWIIDTAGRSPAEVAEAAWHLIQSKAS
jgi:shikimate kinase